MQIQVIVFFTQACEWPICDSHRRTWAREVVSFSFIVTVYERSYTIVSYATYDYITL